MSSQYALIRDGLLEIVHKLSQSILSARLSEVSDIREKLFNWKKETTLLNNVQT